MLRKRSTSRSLREHLAKFFDRADFFVGKGVRYAAAFLIGITTVVIIIAIVSMTRSKSSGNTANTPSTNFVTTTTIITKVITSGVSTNTSSSTSSTATTCASTHKITNASTTTTSTTTSTKRSTKKTFTTSVTTYARNTTKSITMTTKPPAQQAIHCACAVDLHNLNNDTNLLQKEKYLVVDIVDKILNNVGNSTAGLWVYGFVKNTAAKAFSRVFDEMVDDLIKFYEDATSKMVFGPNLSPQNRNLTDTINDGVDPLNVANCLLLLSAMKEVSESWRIEPRYAYKRIVIVSVQGANFTNHVDSRGIAVNVPLDYTPSDVETVFRAIASGFT